MKVLAPRKPSISKDARGAFWMAAATGFLSFAVFGFCLSLAPGYFATVVHADSRPLIGALAGLTLGASALSQLLGTRGRFVVPVALAILGVSAAPDCSATLVRPVFTQGGVGIWQRDGQCLFHEPIATLNAAPALLALQAQMPGAQGMSVVAVSGAVGKLLWRAVQSLLAHHPGLTLVVADGTRLFIDAADLHAFERAGGHLYAMRGIRLLGITLNPFSPFGGSFEARVFLDQARSALAPHLVNDVLLEEEGS